MQISGKEEDKLSLWFISKGGVKEKGGNLNSRPAGAALIRGGSDLFLAGPPSKALLSSLGAGV